MIGSVTALYLFDVAQSIDLAAIRQRLGPRATNAKLDDKGPGPARVRYLQPPVVVDGADLACAELDQFRVRVKFYDYGVISLMLTRPFDGAWSDLLDLSQSLIENESLEQRALDACERVVKEMASALNDARASFLSEDYFVFTIAPTDAAGSADQVVAANGVEIAQIVRGERQPLSRQERDEVLRHRLSYLADDLVVAAWNAAFIYDTDAGLSGAAEILEFANSQLLEFRYHDDLLDRELGQIYAVLQQPRRLDWMFRADPIGSANSAESR